MTQIMQSATDQSVAMLDLASVLVSTLDARVAIASKVAISTAHCSNELDKQMQAAYICSG